MHAQCDWSRIDKTAQRCSNSLYCWSGLMDGLRRRHRIRRVHLDNPATCDHHFLFGFVLFIHLYTFDFPHYILEVNKEKQIVMRGHILI